MDRVRISLDHGAHRGANIFDAGEKTEFIKKSMIDRYVEAAARHGMKETIEAERIHVKYNKCCSVLFITKFLRSFADRFVDEIHAFEQGGFIHNDRWAHP